MTTFELKVKELCDQVRPGSGFSQIVIDLVQDDVEELINADDQVVSEQPAAIHYQIDNLLVIYSGNFRKDINFLVLLKAALKNWSEDIRSNNIVLGLPPQN